MRVSNSDELDTRMNFVILSVCLCVCVCVCVCCACVCMCVRVCVSWWVGWSVMEGRREMVGERDGGREREMEGGREKEKGKSCKKREKEVSETEKQTDTIIWEKNALSKEHEICKENCTHTHKIFSSHFSHVTVM